MVIRATPAAGTPTLRMPKLGLDFGPAGPQTILVVDDSPVVASILDATLGASCTVLAAKSGAEAFRFLQDFAVDLIVLDVLMPEIDGFEVCRQLKADERTAKIPVMFITGLDAAEDEMQALELGAIDFISKPVHPGTLTLRVRNQLELKHYRDFLENLSLLDGLTGIGNRRLFDDVLIREWRRSGRYGLPLSLLLLDIDHFKAYNDTYGHPAGDECLRRVAHLLQATLHRPTDIAARFGGEEFVVVLPHTDLDGALVVAERVRGSVAVQDIRHTASSVANHITVSIGVSSMIPQDGDTAEKLLHAADERLYQAKNSGRDQVR